MKVEKLPSAALRTSSKTASIVAAALSRDRTYTRQTDFVIFEACRLLFVYHHVANTVDKTCLEASIFVKFRAQAHLVHLRRGRGAWEKGVQQPLNLCLRDMITRRQHIRDVLLDVNYNSVIILAR